MDLCSTQADLVRIVIARLNDATQDIAQLRIIISKPQQRFALRPLRTYTKDVFGGRVEADDQEAFVQQDDA